MAKFTHASVLDAALDSISARATHIYFFDEYSQDFATIRDNKLASVPVTTIDFSKTVGDVSGRKMTVSGKSGISVEKDGFFTHLAVVNENTAVVLLITDGLRRDLLAGDTISFDAFDYEIRNPE